MTTGINLNNIKENTTGINLNNIEENTTGIDLSGMKGVQRNITIINSDARKIVTYRNTKPTNSDEVNGARTTPTTPYATVTIVLSASGVVALITFCSVFLGVCVRNKRRVTKRVPVLVGNDNVYEYIECNVTNSDTYGHGHRVVTDDDDEMDAEQSPPVREHVVVAEVHSPPLDPAYLLPIPSTAAPSLPLDTGGLETHSPPFDVAPGAEVHCLHALSVDPTISPAPNSTPRRRRGNRPTPYIRPIEAPPPTPTTCATTSATTSTTASRARKRKTTTVPPVVVKKMKML